MRLKSHIITTLIATLIQTTNQEVSVTEIYSFRNESLVVFPTPKVVANFSPIRQNDRRTCCLLLIILWNSLSSAFSSMRETDGGLPVTVHNSKAQRTRAC